MAVRQHSRRQDSRGQGSCPPGVRGQGRGRSTAVLAVPANTFFNYFAAFIFDSFALYCNTASTPSCSLLGHTFFFQSFRRIHFDSFAAATERRRCRRRRLMLRSPLLRVLGPVPAGAGPKTRRQGPGAAAPMALPTEDRGWSRRRAAGRRWDQRQGRGRERRRRRPRSVPDLDRP